MKRLILSLLIGVSLAVLLQLKTEVAQARVAWCIADLGPMATIAEERNNPHAARAEALDFPVPSVAVSTAKGGANPHK
jgi:hypothetical protein